MKLKLKNIGGIRDAEIDLAKGLNVIRAPNAIGKTSFAHGLQVISLSTKDLKEHTEFLNDFSNEGSVELIDGNKKEDRKIRQKTRDEMGVIGEPIYSINSKKDIIFANPENRFLDSVIKGENVEAFIEKFSDIEHYKALLKIIKGDGSFEYGIEGEIKRTLGELKEDIKEAPVFRKKIEVATVRVQALQKEKEKLDNQISTIDQREQKDRLKKLGEKEGLKMSFIKNLAEAKETISNANKEMPSIDKEIKKKLESIENFDKEHPNIDKEMESIWADVLKLKKKKEEKQKELTEIRLKIKACDRDTDEANCFECGKSFSASERRNRLLKLRKDEIQIESEVNDAANKANTEEKRYSNLENQKTTITQELIEKKEELENEKEQLEIKKRQSEKQLKTLEPEIEKLNNEIKEIKKLLDPKFLKTIEERSRISYDLSTIEGEINSYKRNLDNLGFAEKKAMVYEKKRELITAAKETITKKMKELKNIVREKFNKRIKEVYTLLGFRDFENIEIDEDNFMISVTRKSGGKRIQQSINRLATSERVTIGVIVMLAGKEEYLPDFPFFVLDEVTTAYDPSRFAKIINYIKDKTPYTIVTAFSPSGDRIKVEHSL